MKATNKSNILAQGPVSGLMLKFAIPSIVAMLVGALYNIVDQLFIGQAVGELGNAATNIAFPLTTSCIALSLLFGIGGASCFNLAMGMGKKIRAAYYIGNSITLLSVCGVILCVLTQIFLTPLLVSFGAPADVLPYAEEYVRITAFGFPFLLLTTGGSNIIRADSSPNIAMSCNIIGAVINTVLDAIFVMGMDMGMAGAALATVIGQAVSGLVVIAYMFQFRTVKLKLRHFSLKWKHSIKIISIGMGSFINQVAMMSTQIVLNNSLRHYGALSIYGESTPIACAGIVMKVAQVFFSIIIGIAQGTQPIVSYNYGAANYKRVKDTYKLALISGGALSVLFAVLFQVFPREIISWFGSGSDLYYEFGVKFFRIFLMFTALNFIQPITTTFFTSIGKPGKGAFLSLSRQIIYLMPLLLILPLIFQINGILYAGPVADLLAMATTAIMIILEFKSIAKLEKRQLSNEKNI
ncbi:MAG: MATE family efflux transporter [Acutalibacteraceae bacterium]|nr:MATE family efflux transporter [Acutalibacteraceae bacterium]